MKKSDKLDSCYYMTVSGKLVDVITRQNEVKDRVAVITWQNPVI